ncbi:helix-turn-helix domain-containing protein [Ottowia sp. GY511]|uniref:DNA-3-methyladenine glycosylase II n=1 Tax=Ottowia flava TaxID=2675430 RepID=A0ABW4L0D7_9BURK|nr:DNA-3-methyladenine glycosylase 2 family protein [Ottowia sp. GY511]TXK28522.1 helix-turn-helix domain-containing protein [Ottowia sp. GY511]
MDQPLSAAQADACYRALQTHDARFDGRFFTGVTSTGVYCRPVCRVRTPLRQNCRFFDFAAQAEAAGFRPCLRCRPELAPQAQAWSIQDASATLAQQAARLLDNPEAFTGAVSVQTLADRLGVSDRHLRRIFEARFGVTPLQYLQTRRLLTAKQLLTDTDLPVTQVGLMSGFASLRRFNAAFAQHYGMAPSALRRDGAERRTRQTSATGPVTRLGYRPPYDEGAMLRFLAQRAVPGMEWVDVAAMRVGRSLSLRGADGQWRHGWLSFAFEPERHRVSLQVGDTLRAVLPALIHRVRAWLDLDADPVAINAVLHAHFPDGDGLRVPGGLDGFELAVRAVLGQQVSVAAARTFATRLVTHFGASVDTPWPEVTRAFPTPAALAQADGDALGALGIVRQRQAAITALARAVEAGQLNLQPGADVPSTLAALQALPGIGAWTAHYIALRALRWADAFPAGDVALHNALGVRGERQPARAAEAASQAWRPWRAYAMIRAWTAGTTALTPPEKASP